jgi:short subunit dehydrogenase-like uncharacterized protein
MVREDVEGGGGIEVNQTSSNWALLGATGVTGRLILERAAAKGLRPTLLGRDKAKLETLARPHGLEMAAVDVTDAAGLTAALAGRRLVLNAAGPFAKTSAPVIAAALAAGCDYLDVDGEIDPFAALLNRHSEACARGVALVGGVGFGVAAGDGLAAQVVAKLGGADRLRLAVDAASGYATASVADSTLAVLAAGGREISGGELRARPIGRFTWRETLPDATSKPFASAPLAEIVAIRHALGVPEIVAGAPMSLAQAFALRLMSPVLPYLLTAQPIRRALANTGGHSGADDGKSLISRVFVTAWKDGKTASLTLEAEEGFSTAADIAVAAVERSLSHRPSRGAHTPSTAFGREFVGTVDRIKIFEPRV